VVKKYGSTIQTFKRPSHNTRNTNTQKGEQEQQGQEKTTGKNGYNNTHKEYARRKKWTTPKEGTRLNRNKSFKDEIKQIIL
jgi:hypothetical protein